MNNDEKATPEDAGGKDVVTEIGLWFEKKDATWMSCFLLANSHYTKEMYFAPSGWR